MFGPSSLLVMLLLTASQEDAGLATVSDQTPAIETTVPSGDGEARKVNYVSVAPTADTLEMNKPGSADITTPWDNKKPSPWQAMVQDQNKIPSRNPFKEEESAPGAAIAEPPQRLPPVPANQLPQPPEANPPGNIGGDSTAGVVTACDSCEYGPAAANGGRLAFRDWFAGITCEGWLDQGVTINPYSPRDRSNFPVGFNNRSNDYQMNQLYMRLKREVNSQGDRWDLGGDIDMLYGTDSFYASSRGLEVDRNFGPKWNAQAYGLAMPQCYLEAFAPWGDEGLTVKLGHFYTILGYEVTPAPENFFYSHSFCLLYGEPVTETGLLAEKKLGNFKIQAGATRGWDNWEDNNNDLSFLGGVTWTDNDDRTSLAFSIQSGPEANEPPETANVRNVYSLVFQQKLGEKSQYVFQYDYGQDERDDIHQVTSKWIGLNQYLFHTINEQWKAGIRFEWFRDQTGARIAGARQGADYYELTAGLNWTPNSRVVVRPELRYDWVGTPNYTPYIDATQSYQLLLDCDVIVKF